MVNTLLRHTGFLNNNFLVVLLKYEIKTFHGRSLFFVLKAFGTFERFLDGLTSFRDLFEVLRFFWHFKNDFRLDLEAWRNISWVTCISLLKRMWHNSRVGHTNETFWGSRLTIIFGKLTPVTHEIFYHLRLASWFVTVFIFFMHNLEIWLVTLLPQGSWRILRFLAIWNWS